VRRLRVDAEVDVVARGAEPGSLAYYGGGRWHKIRIEAQSTLEPFVFDGPASRRD